MPKEEEQEEGGLTRSQIKNRKKKEKKSQEQAQKANGVDVSEEAEKGSTSELTNGMKDPGPAQEKKPEKEETKDSTTPISTKTKGTKINGVSTQDSAPSFATPLFPSSTKLPSSTPTHNSSTSSEPPKTNGIKSPSHRSSISRSPSVTSTHSPHPVPSPTSVTELRARLAERIAQSRLARKAVGTSVKGAPQTREAILKARAARKARVEEKIQQKKELQKAQGGEVNGVKEESSDDEIVETGLTFGRVQVGDTEVDAGKGEVKVGKRKKGSSDAKGALNHLLAKKERLEKMDSEKKAKAVENDRWHHALLAARGEKIKDDIGLLKKTIARKDQQKKKSTKAWGERLARVEKAKEDRQKKREDNLAKRREEKGKKGGKKAVKGGKKPVLKKKRPGFEGGRMKIGRK